MAGQPEAAGGSSGAGTGGAAPPPNACASPNILLCEDFESGAIAPGRWSVTQDSATVEVTTGKAARGTHSLLVHVSNKLSGGDNVGYIYSKKTFPLSGATLFIRALVYVPSAVPDRHYSVMEARGTKNPDGSYPGYGLNLVPDLVELDKPSVFRTLRYTVLGPSSQAKNSSQRVPYDQWTCFEWELRGTTNDLYFNLDDKAVPSMTVKGWTAPAGVRLYFGERTVHDEPKYPDGFDLWIDEILVSTQKIGCAL